MNIGVNGQYGGIGRWMSGASQARNEEQGTRGERIVARLDQDGDGKLGLNELAESKIGQRLSIQRMAKMDTNGDGMLEASEFGRPRGAAAAASAKADEAVAATGATATQAPETADPEAVVVAQMADYYTEKVSLHDRVDARAEALAKEIIKRLDADGSGKLNTEEIAGTRLAEKIGEGFYNLDADKSGGLDIDELFGFLYDEIMTLAKDQGLVPAEGTSDVDGLAEAGGAAEEEAVAVAGASGAAEVAETDDAAVQLVEEAVEAAEAEAAEAAEEAAAAEAAEQAGASGSDYEMTAEDLVKTAFENALRMIQEGQEQRSTYDVVSALYGNVKTILDEV